MRVGSDGDVANVAFGQRVVDRGVLGDGDFVGSLHYPDKYIRHFDYTVLACSMVAVVSWARRGSTSTDTRPSTSSVRS